MNKNSLKAAIVKALIVMVPSYTAAYLTEKMVWVVPTLAAASFFAGTVQLGDAPIRRRVDEEEGDESNDILGDQDGE